MPDDFYDRLGVARESSEAEIRTAYRKLAHKYHPDKTGGDKVAEDKLKEINEAYDVLKNKEKRANYDRFGQTAPGAGGAGGAFSGGAAGSPFEDIFDAFFGGAGGRARGGAQAPARGNDLEYPMRITLREAAFGTGKKIHFNRIEHCGDCHGTGAKAGSGMDTCTQCQGAGQVRMSQGFFSITRTCPRCEGLGRVITDPCRACNGSGTVRAERELKVDLPAGVDTGSRLRVAGEGEPGRNGGPRGDLYVFIEVEDDTVFNRDGGDVHCDVPIHFSEAILGGTIKVPTLEGEAELKIPSGTQSGTLFKLRGLGIPDMRGYRKGDQIVHIQVETPTKLSKEQKELIRKFDDLSSTKTYPLHRRFVDKLKKSFRQQADG